MKKLLLVLAISMPLASLPSATYAQSKVFSQGTAANPRLDTKDEYSIDPIKCFSLVNWSLVEPECIQDEKMNEHERQQARAIDRWLRGGLLTLASLMNQSRRLGGIDNMTGAILDEYKKFSQGYTEKRSPMMSYRVVSTRATNDERASYFLSAAKESGVDADSRYFIVEAEIHKGFQNSADMEGEAERASTLAQQLQKRLSLARDTTGESLAEISGVKSIGGATVGQPTEMDCPGVPTGSSGTTSYGCPEPRYDESDTGNEDGGAMAAMAKPAMVAAYIPPVPTALAKAGGSADPCSGGWDTPGKDPVATAYRISAAAEGGLTGIITAVGQGLTDQAQQVARTVSEAAAKALRWALARDHSFNVY